MISHSKDKILLCQREEEVEKKEEEEEEEDDEEKEEEEEVCPVCFSEFDSCLHPPSILPCGHTFCWPCLLHPSLATSGRIHCPLCRKPVWDTHIHGRNIHAHRRDTQIPHTNTHLSSRNTHISHRNPLTQRVAQTTISSLRSSHPRSHTNLHSHTPHRPQSLTHTQQRSVVSDHPVLLFPSHPVGVSVVSEGWLEGRCTLCCQPLSDESSYPLDCRHFLCPHCLGLLLAVASPVGQVYFLYCPQCQGQTAVLRGETNTASPLSSPISYYFSSFPSSPSSPISPSSPPPPSPQVLAPSRGESSSQGSQGRDCGCGGGTLCMLL